MSSTNKTTHYNLPQFADTDIPSWNDINSAFEAIDTALYEMSQQSGISQATAQTMINNAIKNAVFYDASNGKGITSAQYSKLKIKTA